MPISTLTGLDDASGHVVALGPLPTTAGEPLVLPAEVVRELAETCPVLERVLTDAVTGLPLEAERRRYPFGPHGRCHLDVRDGGCRFPGCDVPAARCDADHLPRWPEGESVPGKGALECRPHHNASTHLGFSVSIDAATGVVTWTTPLGAAYTARPRDLPTAEPPVDPLEEEWWEECAADLLFDLDGCDPARWLAEDDLLPDG